MAVDIDGDDVGDERFKNWSKFCLLSWIYLNKDLFFVIKEFIVG